ncbi:type 2 periplasmic-binding domain-containing protein [Candidatus Frankia nodulisporulans]|uniref:hypothetical protein n=1 Tax=Candidatus Frankia nodulisporulans TaxID=2060052 RepID=UPI00178343F5|nr:hypothetical protein [Candidatus Frankia nodulisporulans]
MSRSPTWPLCRCAWCPAHAIPSWWTWVLHACRDAGFQPVPSPLTGSTLEDTLAAIGAGTPTWTVLYAAHAQGLHAPRVAFRTPRGTRLSVPTSLCVRATAPTPYLPLLLDACAAAGHHDS